MTTSASPEQIGSTLQPFDAVEAIGDVLGRGHVIHGFATTVGERVVKILATVDYADDAEVLGQGVGNRAEPALTRALVAYAERERDGLPNIDTVKQAPPDLRPAGLRKSLGHSSKFDNILWLCGVKMHQEGGLVVAQTLRGGGHGVMALEVAEYDAMSAITDLTETYTFPTAQMLRLPVIDLNSLNFVVRSES